MFRDSCSTSLPLPAGMRGGEAIGAALRNLSGARGNELRGRERGVSTDGCLRAELHSGCLGCQHPGWNLEGSSRWIADGHRAVATAETRTFRPRAAAPNWAE